MGHPVHTTRYPSGSGAGLKVRIFESPLLARFWERNGRQTRGDSLAQGSARLAEWRGGFAAHPKSHLYPLGFCRRGRFVTLLGDVSPLLMVAVNEARYNCLPPGVQTALIEACDASGEFFSQEVVRAETENEPANMRRYGATYLKVDIKPWQIASRKITDKLMTEWPEARKMWRLFNLS